jgi:peptidoglycan/xylan/chitin deacetylase (PgdA/CDA1 family)
MNRRTFLTVVSIGAARLLSDHPSTAMASPSISITMDDPRVDETPLFAPEERNRRILEALRAHANLKTALFVCGRRVDHEAGRALLRAWDNESHIIANHSYSHSYYHSANIDIETFSKDILQGEAVIKDFAHFRKMFRFPFLKEGNTVEKRDRIRTFLKERGYRTGHVTIDASDWYIDQRLRERLEKDPKADIAPYRNYYLSHLEERATFYRDLAVKALNRDVKHTILLHHNLLNALCLGDVLSLFRQKGWNLISAGEAFQDPVFSAAPNIVPAGESIIWALAKETGKFDALLRYPGEDGEYEKERMDRLGL